MTEQTENIVGMRKKIKAQAEHVRRLEQRIRELKQAEQSELRAMILNALDRDAAEGKAVRGEMADELRAALSAQGAPQ